MKRRRILKITSVVLLCVAVILAGAYAWLHNELTRRLPQTTGVVPLDAIQADIDIIRDDHGIPHIFARNEFDLYFAWGYTVAQDRFWQMEFLRRLGQGQLAELFGEDLIQTDLFFRLLGAGGMPAIESPRVLSLIQGYCDGINGYLENHRGRLPIEFTLLNCPPAAWTVEDIQAVFMVMNWGLSAGWHIDLTAHRIRQIVDDRKFREVFPDWSGDAPVILALPTPIRTAKSGRGAGVPTPLSPVLGVFRGFASNNWVVAGAKSASGKPILANDTHMGLSFPSIWWEVHLQCPSLNVGGFATPGLPAIPIGRNPHVAWGVTNVQVDDVDFYFERINPDNPTQYWVEDHWEDMRVIEETIKVKDQPAVTVELKLTRHGPILNDALEDAPDQPVSARWAYFDGQLPDDASYRLLKARSVDDVVDALRSWELPGQNFVFGDSRGNIGYWCSALVPVRPDDSGMLPLPGWTNNHEWRGYVSFDQRPHDINPENGFICSANNRPAAEGFPFYLGNYWEPPSRIKRIEQLLTSQKTLSTDDFQQIQLDNFNSSAEAWVPDFLRILEQMPADSRIREVRAEWQKWDYRMTKDSVAACLFEVTYRALLERIFKDEMGADLYRRYLKTVVFPPRALQRIMVQGGSAWIDDVTTEPLETLDDIIAASIRQAIGELRRRQGDSLQEWRWGRLHTLTFKHVLGRKPPLGLFFNRGPFSIDGSHLTLSKAQYDYNQPYQVVHGVSQRMIVDLADPDRALHVLSTGQSGQLKSGHCDDQIELYLDGRYHEAWMKRRQLAPLKTKHLLLTPDTGVP